MLIDELLANDYKDLPCLLYLDDGERGINLLNDLFTKASKGCTVNSENILDEVREKLQSITVEQYEKLERSFNTDKLVDLLTAAIKENPPDFDIGVKITNEEERRVFCKIDALLMNSFFDYESLIVMLFDEESEADKLSKQQTDYLKMIADKRNSLFNEIFHKNIQLPVAQYYFPTSVISAEIIKGNNNPKSLQNDTFLERMKKWNNYTITKKGNDVIIEGTYLIARAKEEEKDTAPTDTQPTKRRGRKKKTRDIIGKFRITYKDRILEILNGRHRDNTFFGLYVLLMTRLFNTLWSSWEKSSFKITVDDLLTAGIYKTKDSAKNHFLEDFKTFFENKVILDFDRMLGGEMVYVQGVRVFGTVTHIYGTDFYTVEIDRQNAPHLRQIFCKQFTLLGDAWTKLKGDAQKLYMYLAVQMRINSTGMINRGKKVLSLSRTKQNAIACCGFPTESDLKGDRHKNDELKRIDKAIEELQNTPGLEFDILNNGDNFVFCVNQSPQGFQLHSYFVDIAAKQDEELETNKI